MPQSTPDEHEVAGEEILAALKDITSAHTLVCGVFEALPRELQCFGADATRMLDQATWRLRGLYTTATSAPPRRDPPDVVSDVRPSMAAAQCPAQSSSSARGLTPP